MINFWFIKSDRYYSSMESLSYRSRRSRIPSFSGVRFELLWGLLWKRSAWCLPKMIGWGRCVDGNCFWFSHDSCSTGHHGTRLEERNWSRGSWSFLPASGQIFFVPVRSALNKRPRSPDEPEGEVGSKAKPTSRTRSSNPCTPSIRAGWGAVLQEFAVSQERCEWWSIRHDVEASKTTLGATTGHTSFVSGRWVVLSRSCSSGRVNIIRLGRLTALQKPTGDVRGIVAGEVLRRLVARTMAQQLGPAVENFTASFQFALTIRSGCECVAHTIQALCQADPELTLTSLEGVSAFDLISRRAMLEGLAHVPGGASALPFVHLFYGRPSRYLWEDDHGVACDRSRRRWWAGRPAHASLVRSRPTCRVGGNAWEDAGQWEVVCISGQHLHPDVSCKSRPSTCHCGGGIGQTCTHQHQRGQNSCVEHGRGGTRRLRRVARGGCCCRSQCASLARSRGRAGARGSCAWSSCGPPKLRESPVEWDSTRSPNIVGSHTVIPRPPVQLAVAAALRVRTSKLLSSRGASCFGRGVCERAWSEFVEVSLCRILGIGEGECQDSARSAATLPLALGGLGLWSALRTRSSAFWASWVDCLPMVFKRYPDWFRGSVGGGSRSWASPMRRSSKVGWGPRFRDPFLESTYGRSPASTSRSWRRRTGKSEARVAARGIISNRAGIQRRAVVPNHQWCPAGPSAVPEWSGCRYVLVHHALQSCDPSGLLHVPHPPLSSTPFAAPFDEALLPVPPYRFLWPPPRSLCSVTGSCSSGFCGGERGCQSVSWGWGEGLNQQMVRDMDLAIPIPGDSRRIEVLADGLALFGGVQLAIDTTLQMVQLVQGLRAMVWLSELRDGGRNVDTQLRAQQPMSIGCVGRGSRRAMVRWNSHVHQVPGTVQSPFRTTVVTQTGWTGLETPVVVFALLRDRPGVCLLLGGPSSAGWRRREPPFGLRSWGRAAVRCVGVSVRWRSCAFSCLAQMTCLQQCLKKKNHTKSFIKKIRSQIFQNLIVIQRKSLIELQS